MDQADIRRIIGRGDRRFCSTKPSTSVCGVRWTMMISTVLIEPRTSMRSPFSIFVRGIFHPTAAQLGLATAAVTGSRTLMGKAMLAASSPTVFGREGLLILTMVMFIVLALDPGLFA